jgi:hypothetical protein
MKFRALTDERGPECCLSGPAGYCFLDSARQGQTSPLLQTCLDLRHQNRRHVHVHARYRLVSP